ncbi:hypothetical protein [Actinospongicola halichondriae]|uniref:hypothetical protein n=1 Tax=Actinospongicola halichondriae TaxID=3236844 RepID=UPI003D530BDD
MAAPEHVPTKPNVPVRSYSSPPRRPESWSVDRPADFAGSERQPSGERLGSQGPDQGYALKLARIIEPELTLADGEHARDALAGIVAIGLKRASLLGRAPVIHDLRIGATLFGYLDPAADPALVRFRKELFEEVGHFHHYAELRHIADLVEPAVLRQTPDQVRARYDADWQDQLSLDD